ncbi:hypothetical protein CONCODRAFT_14011, partial [Conidiobolus coronatus NRRL 28638]
MKFNYVLLLIPLAQSAPLVDDLLGGQNGSGLITGLPVVGPFLNVFAGPTIKAIP